MKSSVYVFDPTVNDKQSRVRGVGRYLQLLKENFPDWIFTNKLLTTNYQLLTTFINPFFNFLQPPTLIRRIAQKQIAVIHDLIPLKYLKHFPAGIRGNINIFLNKLALKNYDIIITDSETSKKDILQMLNIQPDKIKVIYPCLPKIFIDNNLKTKNLKLKTISQNLKLNKKISDLSYGFDIYDLTFKLGNKYCLYVGDATWNKNLVNLVRAIKIINVTCVFVGKVFEEIKKLRNKEIEENQQSVSNNFNQSQFVSQNNIHPWNNELNQFINEVKNDKRFIFLGFVDDYRLIKLYQQARCNILVSRDEGFGFSYLEAASQVCPTVLSNIPVLKEVAGSSYHWFTDPNDPNEIANKIGELYFNNDLRSKIGLEARQRVKYFSQNNFFIKWKELSS